MNLRKNILQSVVVVISMTILKANATCAPLLAHSVRQLAGDQVDRLCEVYQGQVVMIVNTASNAVLLRSLMVSRLSTENTKIEGLQC